MRGFAVTEYLHPSKISLSSDVPEPKPAEDEILVDVYSAGLNFFDVGAMPPFPQKAFTYLQRTDSANAG